jgi:hypothetical protein
MLSNGVFNSDNIPPGTPAVSASGTSGAGGIVASSDTSTAIIAQGFQGVGVWAIGGGVNPTGGTLPVTAAAIFAECGPGPGVYAISDSGLGVYAQSTTGTAVSAFAGAAGVALGVEGKIQINPEGHSVGSVTMEAGTKTLTVHNAAATANSLVLLTPYNDPQAFLWIGARNAQSFTIDASKALPTNVIIMFLIIN